MKRNLLVLIAFGLILSACTASQQTSDQKPKEKEIYVFDDANVKSTKDTAKAVEQVVVKENIPNPAAKGNEEFSLLKGMNYIVQLGAFSTQEKAEKFVAENRNLLAYEMRISFSDAVKLFVVQIPPVSAKEEAEKIRNKLWETSVFKDAFIVTLEKK
jgi:cell division septation protein DedD